MVQGQATIMLTTNTAILANFLLTLQVGGLQDLVAPTQVIKAHRRVTTINMADVWVLIIHRTRVASCGTILKIVVRRHLQVPQVVIACTHLAIALLLERFNHHLSLPLLKII